MVWVQDDLGIANLPVLFLREIEGGKIERWHEFWNMRSLIAEMPASWLEDRARQMA
ncbi:MAG: hypothetical protein JRG86_22200 [Deltaproteobacteria bacterium]|jgi:hypothetical protein|nr:hypothetical protein [Deltaproteobacteria bacterium]MBW2498251.1 hypothetical protein [Deltaproteobacteria bacterium]